MATTTKHPPAASADHLTVSRRRRRHQTLVAWGFAAPFMVLFVVFLMVPVVSSLAMSFTDFRSSDVQTPFAVAFVGLDQYSTLFADPLFRRSLVNTALYVLLGIPLTMAVALVLAIALNNGISRFRPVFRIGFYTPVVTSIVAVSVVWRFILTDDGLLNSALGFLGLDGPDWLNDTRTALPSLIVMSVWRNMGTLMIIFLAGLQNVPREVLEAGEVDGAGAWRRLVSITLPTLRPTLLLGSVLLSVGFLQFFEEAYVMTGGGPLNSTLSISYFIFNQFSFGRYGYAAAASYVLFLAIALLSLVQFRVLRPQE